MKILFFSHDAYMYGASRSMVNIIQGLRQNSIYCKVILPNKGPLEQLLNAENIEYTILKYPWWTNSIGESVSTHETKGIRAHITRLKQRYTRFIKIIIPILNWKHIKLVKDFDLVVSNTSVIATGFFFASLLRLPHVWFIREFADLDFGLKISLGNKFAAKAFQRSELMVFNSSALAKHYAKNFSIKTEHSLILHNGVFFKEKFIEKKNERLKVKKESSQFIFCIIGHIFKPKGQWEAVDALNALSKEYPNIRLWVVGGGAIDELTDYVAKSGLDHFVKIFGFLEDVSPIFLDIDCLLVCSAHEAFGRAAVEALAYGIPVIGRDSGGTPEIIEHEKTGLLYQGDTLDLILCMRRIITDPILSKKIGDNGWLAAYDRFNIEVSREKLLAAINKYFKE